MSDPDLAARAQRAAERLEQSWDRWRRLHGLATEQAQPVSSYVGYSLAEPWGQPRVVFGVGAAEAERLAALLEQDEAADPRFSQGLLWETEPRAQYGVEAGGTSFAQPSSPVADHTGPLWQREPRGQHGNGAASGGSFAQPSGPVAEHPGPQAVPTSTGGAPAADIAAPAESSRHARPDGEFEPPNRDLPRGGDPGRPGWTRVGSPPPHGVLRHWPRSV
jgi:hypothetical protein